MLVYVDYTNRNFAHALQVITMFGVCHLLIAAGRVRNSFFLLLSKIIWARTQRICLICYISIDQLLSIAYLGEPLN